MPVKRPVRRSDVVLDLSVPDPEIIASDPYTAPAYAARTGRHCEPLSFAAVAEGRLPPLPENSRHKPSTPSEDDICGPDAIPRPIDMVISSFALHLCSTSELFALLYELSTKAQWLVVIAPHKKPDIKEGWGWERWNISKWKPADSIREVEADMEIVLDRVRLRVWRSLNA